jgi:hypothetical protein
MARTKKAPIPSPKVQHSAAQAIALVWLTAGSIFTAYAAGTTRQCSVEDFQACRSCPQLEAAIDLTQPSAGDYYRGAHWNGLYAAYVLNCPMIGAKLIHAGADPAIGGTNGSMILTVSSKWPHNSRKINEAWAAMLLASGANMGTALPSQNGQNTSQLLPEATWFKPDYFDLLAAFQR